MCRWHNIYLNDQKSNSAVPKTLNHSQNFVLKPNILKCEVAGIGPLKGVKIAVCDIKCIDFTTETIEIVGVGYK